MEPEAKRLKSDDSRLAIGDEVRIINLPAYPGLEGLTGQIVGLDDKTFSVDVELKKNKVVKRLKQDKVRRLFTGQLVALHGLVSAFKLNGQLAECVEFDVELQRYVVLLKSGETKKVKPQNISPIGKLRTEMANTLQLRALLEEKNKHSSRSDIIALLKKWDCVLPSVVSSRVLVDWAKLESSDLRKRLLDAKRVRIDTLPNDLSVVFLSIPRKTLALKGDIEEEGSDMIDRVKSTVRKLVPLLEDEILGSQVYWILPFETVESIQLPMVQRAFECTYPLIPFLCDSTVMCLNKNDDPLSLKYSAQRLDAACASKAGTKIWIHRYDMQRPQRSEDLKLSLPSRGYCEDNQLTILREIEKSINILRPVDDESSFIIQCKTI
jgi:hypothetical protein